MGAAFVAACGSPANQRPPIGDAVAPRACPTQLDLELIATSSRFDPGFSGIAHGVGLSTGSALTVDVTGCDPECRRCEFEGPVRGDPATRPVINQRCLNNYAQICGQDSDCPDASGPCRFMFPPIAARIAVESCALTYFEPTTPAAQPIAGVIDLLTGETDFSVFDMRINVVIADCPDCQGDTTPFDGNPQGTCSGSTTACDVHGIGTTVASQTSFDCPPAGGTFLEIPLPGAGTTTSSRAWTMDDTRPMCTAQNATTKHCWCGVCDDGSPCTSTNQCASGTCGAATVGGAPVATDNHTCGAGNTCTWDATTQRGACSNAPTRACFPDTGTITARGSTEVRDGFYVAQLANLLCLPSFGGLLDPVSGFPGPLYFQARFRVTPRTVAP